MFTLTPAAATQIRKAAAAGGMADLALRIAACQESDGSIAYGMGFDEAREGEVPSLQIDGVTVLIATPIQPLLQDTLLDFVELSPGEFNFIFMPQPVAPRTDGGCGGCGGGGCASHGAS
jgi:iron-sulfur cluster assembly protein